MLRNHMLTCIEGYRVDAQISAEIEDVCCDLRGYGPGRLRPITFQAHPDDRAIAASLAGLKHSNKSTENHRIRFVQYLVGVSWFL